MKSIIPLILIFNSISIFFSTFRVVEAILGGSNTNPNVHGYQVSIQANGKHIGVGTLISNLHVLSAASLFIGSNELFIDKVYTVVGGVANLNEQNKIIGIVDKISIPRNYLPPTNDAFESVSPMDISVLKLTERFHFTQMARMGVVAVPQAMPRASKLSKEKGTVTGFGVENCGINDYNQSVENICEGRCINLKAIDSIIMLRRSCEGIIHANVHENHFCAKSVIRSQTVSGLCYGDIGAPFIYNGMIVGILIKHRYNCNENYYPSIYTNVRQLIHFIEQAKADANMPRLIRVANRRSTPTEGILEHHEFI